MRTLETDKLWLCVVILGSSVTQLDGFENKPMEFGKLRVVGRV